MFEAVLQSFGDVTYGGTITDEEWKKLEQETERLRKGYEKKHRKKKPGDK